MMFLRSFPRAVIFFCLAFLALASARAELAVWEKFERGGQGVGWAGGWSERKGLEIALDNGALVGQGMAERPMLRGIDFDREGEWYLSARILRRGAGASPDADFATVSLIAAKAAPDDRLAHFGICSREAFDVGLTSDEHQIFGEAGGDQAYTMVVRLRTSADDPDELTAWAWPTADVAPTEPPDQPMARSERELSGVGSVIRWQTGLREGLEAEFQEFRVGSSWADVTEEAPSVAAAPSEFRKFTTLRVTDNGVHALPIQWAAVSVLPTAPGKPPEIVVNSTHEWLAEPVMIFKAADAVAKAGALPTPNPNLPLYGPATPSTLLGRGNHQAVRRLGGGFDVYHIPLLERIAEIDAKGTFKPLPAPEPIFLGEPGDDTPRDKIIEALRDRPGADLFMGDVDGDDVPDLLIGKMANADEQWTYWPERDGPWVLDRRPKCRA